jgi:hypothetical protein
LVVAQLSSEVPEGLMNNPVYAVLIFSSSLRFIPSPSVINIMQNYVTIALKVSGQSIFLVVFTFLMFLYVLFYILLSEIEFCLHSVHTSRNESNQLCRSGSGSDLNTENQTQRNGVSNLF